MAAPPAFSTYVALSQERQARNLELKRAAFFIMGVTAIALVCLFYLNLRTLVVIRSEEVRLMGNQKTEQLNRNQELAYRIAWETAPQRVEERAKKLKLAPIAKWEAMSIPGLADKLKVTGQIPTTAPIATTKAPEAAKETKLNLEQILLQIKNWLGLGLRTPTVGQKVP